MKKDLETYAMSESKLKKLEKEHADAALAAFMMDMDEGRSRDGTGTDFLKRSGLLDVIIDTYQQRGNRRFYRCSTCRGGSCT
jgi:hypothetical protein